jgi:hypothetical protein
MSTTSRTSVLEHPSGVKVTTAVTLEVPDVVTPPPPQGGGIVIPKDANAVRVGGYTFPLAYVDPPAARNSYPGERGPNELGFYTEAYGLRADVNSYGWSVQVMADGYAVVPGGSGQLIIPTQGGVLTGHDSGVSTSAAAFVKGIKDGDRVEFIHQDVIAPPVDPPHTGGVPAWVCSGYWQQYQGPDLLTVLNNAPGYNLLLAAFALGGGGQNMTFTPRTYSAYSGSNGDAVFIEHVKKIHDSGRRMGVSFGGGVNASAATVLRNDAEGKAVFNGMKTIIDRYGFTVIDVDTENGPAGFSYEGLYGLLGRIRDTYGPDFIISSAPRPYEDFFYSILGQLVAKGCMDIVQSQFYDAPEYKDATFLKNKVKSVVNSAAQRGVPVGRHVIGAICWPGYPYGWNTVDAYLTAAAGVPGVRGLMHWENSLDSKIGWQFAAKVSAAAPKVA